MKKNILNFEPGYDFTLLALVTGLKSYRLCWMMEEYLNIRLHRSEDLQLTSGREKVALFFPVYENQPGENEFQRISLVGNKIPSGFLVSEQKVVDYYIKLEGDFSDEDMKHFENTFLKSIKVQHVFRVDPNSLKAKQNLLF